ncbi:iron/zinc purple acid phosphatase-like protein [Ochromonadaceae sp. CCMP2298]|nr:iron/zinc purple acid phosphatase-like protein [Ochromonadaceae sp. CCMP2298]|mmetsp:Transcript_27224/g.60281  ORF Transcript_27224/g.60281 Transcript_27224/m.60281 type:complete len:472 (-) Transcript_27224:190-1605(-)|eukprot:CAMPEP_0173194140 /NCGR_PEP_ID=MMETSP1141-20130122/14344_1 /TAXON_ID=483371 /ORGANISM="non described non described, Strain CCMP2298" /LENGTH=471 /DNA_ID=CAMNT_0014118545 /DNA_START=116 /DNA_END=1531 /DNA_ORIENTATION=-
MLFILAVLAAVVCGIAADNAPTQVHIALAGMDISTGNSNKMAASWNTDGQTPTSTVKYGSASTVYDTVVTGTSSAYYETYNHHVVFDTLSPAKTYYYIVGDDVNGWSKEFSFKSAPLSSELRGNFSFLVYGDMGVVNGDPTRAYINANKDSVELVWHAGDVGYADDSFLHKGCVTKFCYEETFDSYMEDVEPWASQLPYMVTPGNHEADCHDPACLLDSERREKLSNFTAYNGRFRMPSEETGGVLNMHYSFNYGNVHFISLDTETGYPGAAEETRYVLPCGGFGDQLTWLENDLIKANADRELRPWILAAGHHPMYNGKSINADFQTAMEGLFYKYGVDVYFAGHVHSYERDLPVYQGVPEADYDLPLATTHLLIGGAGNDEMRHIQLDHSTDPAPHEGPGQSKWFESDEDGPWTVTTDKDDHVGIGKVIIHDDSTLTFEYIRTITGEVFDSFTLTRDHSRYLKTQIKTA